MNLLVVTSTASQTSIINGIRATDIAHILRDKIAIYSGGKDRSVTEFRHYNSSVCSNGCPIIVCPQREDLENVHTDHLRMIFSYLQTIPP